MRTAEQRTYDEPATGQGGGRRRWWRFVLHYLEMAVAMLAGMFILGGVVRAVLAVAGVDYSLAALPEVVLLEMALTMAAGMAAWMRFRGHDWAPTLEMTAAMLVPAAIMVPLVWLAGMDGEAAMMLEHIVMFPLMLVVMLRRRDEYATAHRRGRVGNRLLHRDRAVENGA